MRCDHVRPKYLRGPAARRLSRPVFRNRNSLPLPSTFLSPTCVFLPTMTTTLPLLHFNDVYRVNPQKLAPGSSDTIDVTQFAAMLDDLRQGWNARPDGAREGLVLFSGDVFAPSVESSVTRGSHMVSRCGRLTEHLVDLRTNVV